MLIRFFCSNRHKRKVDLSERNRCALYLDPDSITDRIACAVSAVCRPCYAVIFKKGVRITARDNAVSIELHIIVRYGVNIAATGNSIISEIRYKVEQLTGVKVYDVILCVDGIMTDDMTEDGKK